MYRVNYSKYYSKRTVSQGTTFQSKGEANFSQELEFCKVAGEYTEIKKQVPIPIAINGKHIGNYIMDFVAVRPDGKEEWIEYKGFKTDLWRWKWKCLEALYGDDPMIILKLVLHRQKRWK